MRAWLALALILPIAVYAQTRGIEGSPADDARQGEVQALLPEFPKPENYLPLPVSVTTAFEFFVDAKSISVGKDGIMRYSLIAKSTEGVLNVSYEGIRCSSREFRVFAYGRSDKSWSEVRISQWQPIPADTRNAQRAVLYGDYFCSKSHMIGTAEDVVRALRQGPPQAPTSGY